MTNKEFELMRVAVALDTVIRIVLQDFRPIESVIMGDELVRLQTQLIDWRDKCYKKINLSGE